MTSTAQSKNRVASPRSDALWNLAGCSIYAGCQWLVLVATVKLSTPAEVGRLSLGFAITAPIFLLLHLRLRAASATDAQMTFSRGDYIALRVVCTALALLASALVCLAVALPREDFAIVMLVALAKAVESGSDLLYGLSQRADNLRAVALSLAARGVAAVTAFAFLLQRTHQLGAALGGLCGAWAIVFLLVDLPAARKDLTSQDESGVSSDWSFKSIARLAWITLPLGLSTMFMSLGSNMPRYFVKHSLGVSALGIFSATAYLTMYGSVAISAIAESSIARMARMLAAQQTAEALAILNRVRDITLLLSAVLIGGSIIAGGRALGLLYRPEYSSARWLLVFMMVAAGAANLASVYGYALIAARKFRAYLVCLAFSTLGTAIFCAVAVPRWGARGAVFACLGGYILQAAVAWTLLRNTFAVVGAKRSAAPLSIALNS